jgi:Copper type II ascorbate-dependent monooxygenase, N-terminal domain
MFPLASRAPIALVALGVALAACSSSPNTEPNAEPTTPASGGPVAAVTFHKDVEPILQRSCQGCHVPGGIAPFGLVSYQEAHLVAAGMVEQTTARSMPPWHALNTAECTPPLGWKNDLRLTDAEVATISAWHDAGAPEGDPKDAPPARALTGGLPGVALELKPQTPFSLAPKDDQFRCFVFDPKLTSDAYVNGVFVVPGNSAVVHHVLVFTDPSGASRAMADGSMSYDCFGGSGIADSELLAAWAPGGVPLEYPPNVAVPVAAGSLLVMQVHYHPHSETEAASDATTVQLRFGAAPPQYRAISKLIGNFRTGLPGGDGLLPGPGDPATGVSFLIPAGASGHTESMQLSFTSARLGGVAPYLYGVGGHMHLVGVDEKISLAKADGTNQCLLQIPHWDFDWQRRYDYDAAIEKLPLIAPGDKLQIRCTYDNTMQNPKVVGALKQQNLQAPSDVGLGETTLDEMCLAVLTALYPAGK